MGAACRAVARADQELFRRTAEEMRRVTWPSWKQVRATTVVVIVAVFVFAAYFCAWSTLLVGPSGINTVFEVISQSRHPNMADRDHVDFRTGRAGRNRRWRACSAEEQPVAECGRSRRACRTGGRCRRSGARAGDDRRSPRSWYIIHTYSGFRTQGRESLRTRAEAFGFADKIGEILIPEEEVVEMRDGKKVTSKRLLYPGYVIVQMEMSDEMRHYVKDTPRVTGFVGGGTDPVPLTSDEVNKILYRQATAAERPRPKLTFEKNETVRIVDGPFANFYGQGRRGQQRAQHAASAGHDLRPRDAGRARFSTGGKDSSIRGP